MFTNYGASDIVEAKGIEALINDFNTNTNNFKQSMEKIDFAEKLKQNNKSNKLQDCFTDGAESYSSSAKLPREKIKLVKKS